MNSAALSMLVSSCLQNVMAIFRRRPPPQRGRQMQAGMKIRDFQPISRFISEMIQDGASDVIKAKLLGPRPQPSRPRPLRLRLEHKDTQYV